MERFERTNSIESNKEKYLQARKDVDYIVDGLGRGIDEDIKDTVAILKAMEFCTDSSCAGHALEEDHLGFPYVRFYMPEPDNWKEDPKQRELWKQSNLLQRDRFMPLLTEFNTKRDVKSNAILQTKDVGLIGGFEILSKGVYGEWKSKKEVMEAIPSFQKEMADFTTFLKSKFLS